MLQFLQPRVPLPAGQKHTPDDAAILAGADPAAGSDERPAVEAAGYPLRTPPYAKPYLCLGLFFFWVGRTMPREIRP